MVLGSLPFHNVHEQNQSTKLDIPRHLNNAYYATVTCDSISGNKDVNWI